MNRRTRGLDRGVTGEDTVDSGDLNDHPNGGRKRGEHHLPVVSCGFPVEREDGAQPCRVEDPGLGKINDERVLEPLLTMLRNDEFKDDATWALAELGQPAIEKLLECLEDKDEVVRKQATLALGEIKDSASVEPLIQRLKDQDWFIRLSAAAALEKIGDPRGREAVKPLLKDPDMVVRLRIERMLAAWKKQAVSA